LAAEHNQLHLTCWENEELVGCLVVVLVDTKTIKMRQVAVDDSCQQRGIGSAMVQYLEDWMQQEGYDLVYCHARDTAVPFYLKHNYYTVGKPFEEVTIKHYRMEKKINQRTHT